jgi:hypothetical protein
MDAMYDESSLDRLAAEVYTLPSMLLDQTAAVAAAERMYTTHRAGVRFYSDFRRVISVAEMMAMTQGPLDEEPGEETVDPIAEDETVSSY